MTLGTATAALLHRSVDALLLLTGRDIQKQLSLEALRSALQQLTATTEAAAKLADVAQLEALAVLKNTSNGGDVERIRAQPDGPKPEAEKVSGEARSETELVKAELEKARAETEMVKLELETVRAEMMRAEMMRAEMVRVEEARAEMMRESKARLEKMRTENEMMQAEMGRLMEEGVRASRAMVGGRERERGTWGPRRVWCAGTRECPGRGPRGSGVRRRRSTQMSNGGGWRCNGYTVRERRSKWME